MRNNKITGGNSKISKSEWAFNLRHCLETRNIKSLRNVAYIVTTNCKDKTKRGWVG